MSYSATKEEILEATIKLAAARIASGHNPSSVADEASQYVGIAESLLRAVNQRMDGKAWIELK